MVAPIQFREIRFGTDQYRLACALRDKVLRAPLGLPLGADDLQGEADQLHFGLFATSGELIACVQAIVVSASHAKIRQTAVSPEYQRNGSGRRLMAELESTLSARNFTLLTLHARSTVVGFYEKLGYETDGDEFMEVTIPHRRMAKRLT